MTSLRGWGTVIIVVVPFLASCATVSSQQSHVGKPAASHTWRFPYSTYLWVWGINGFGELGNHASVDSDRPLLNFGLPAGTLITKLAAGDAYGNVGSQSFALDRNHGVWGWGYNQFGQVGDGNASADANVYGPARVCAGGQTAPCSQFFVATGIAAGGFHSLGLDNFGRVWGWGYNASGQLGTTGPYSAVPVWNVALSAQLSTVGGAPIKAIAAGSNHSLALDSFGNVWAWGSNGYGQLGNGLAGSYPPDYAGNIAYRIGSFPAGTTITAIAAGGSHSLALDNDGNVWAWGWNGDGQLGLGSFQTTVNTPRKLTTLPSGARIVVIAAGALHSLVLDSAGNVRAFGDNFYGQLGNETNIDSHGPVQATFPTGTRIISIAAGGGHSLAIDADNNVWAWGYNNHGQLGNQQTGLNSNKPLRSIFPAGTRIVGIAAGSLHSLALESRSFFYGIEAVLDFQPLTAQAVLVPQSLTLDSITVTATSSPLDRTGRKFLVTDTLRDTGGNELVLTFSQQQNGNQGLALEIQSVQYNGGLVATPPPNRIQYAWTTDTGGAVASFDQHILLGRASTKTEITSSYDAKTNQTTIHVETPSGTQDFTAPGMITLQISTVNGNLVFSDGIHTWP